MRTLPTMFRNLVATLPPNDVFPEVRVLSIGGEPMYRGDVEAFNAHFAPSCMIAHGLGPTECFMVCLNYVPHGTRIAASKLDIGWPVADKEVLLLDRVVCAQERLRRRGTRLDCARPLELAEYLRPRDGVTLRKVDSDFA